MEQLQGCTALQGTICRHLKACIVKKDLETGRQLQSLILENELQSVSVLGDHLIRLFASCGSLFSAVEAFHRIKQPTVYSWNAVISAHVKLGERQKALVYFRGMQKACAAPDVVTFLWLAKACAGLGDLSQGRTIHNQFLRHDLQSSAFENSLIDMYAKCGSLDDAHHVFVRLASRSIVSWGALLAGYVENNDTCSAFKLYKEMKESGLQPNRAIFLCLLKACICVGSFIRGMLAHDELIKRGLDSDLMVGNSLMDFYVKLFCLDEAMRVFDNLLCPDVVSWDIRIAGLADNGHNISALKSYKEMQSKDLKPDIYTYSSVLKACADEGMVIQGKLVHDQILRCGFETNIAVANTLVDMYGKCALIREACDVFHNMASPDVVSWSTVIARCAEHGFGFRALGYFEKMQQGEVWPNKALYICALKACISAGNLVLGRILHDWIIRDGVEIDLMIGSTLLNVYGNHGSLGEAGVVLSSLKESNEVTWGLMIAACVQHDDLRLAVIHLRQMLSKQIHVDRVSLLGIVKGCSKSGAIVCGRLVHSLVIESGFGDDEMKSALMDMYTKCGSSYDSSKLLDSFSAGNNIAFWDVKVASMARSGCFEAAHHCLQIMGKQAIQPDRLMFLGLLSACSSAGVFEEGLNYFLSMRNDFGVDPGIDEYNVMVDLLGRMGFSEEAEALLLSMPFSPDLVSWISLLSRCKAFFNVALARRSFDEIIQRDPNDASGYVLMASIFADGHKWQDLMDIKMPLCQADLRNKGMVNVDIEQLRFFPCLKTLNNAYSQLQSFRSFESIA